MLELIHNNKDHSDITQLLPWYVNGTLSEDEHHLVEEHVFNCQSCQQEIKFLNSSFDVLNHDNAALTEPKKQFDQVMERIETSQKPKSNTSSVTKVVVESMHRFSKQQFAIAACFIAALLTFYWYIPSDTQSPSTYQTLTSPGGDSVKLQINFNDQVNANKIEEIATLLDTELTVTDIDPVYTISIPADYDLIKLSQLLKTLNSRDYISSTNVISNSE